MEEGGGLEGEIIITFYWARIMGSPQGTEHMVLAQ